MANKHKNKKWEKWCIRRSAMGFTMQQTNKNKMKNEK